MANPYIQVHRRIARHTGFSWRPWVPVLAAVVALPWIAPSLLGFLPSPGDAVEPKLWVPALSNLVSRLANLIAAMVILHSYTDLVRGSDRDVLDVHPVRATALVRAIALRTARTRIYLPVMGGVVLTPVAMGGHMMAYWGAVGVLFAAWLGGLGVGFMVHLGGVWAAFSPRFAALLDAVRGDNPRMQAALIYAPGVALLLVGLGVEFAAIGLELALTGWSVGWAWVAIPAAVGAAAFATVGPLAERFYVRASLLLAEVDGAWGQAQTAELAESVYLERLGQRDAEAVRALRLGWRSLRIHATGGWVAGVLIALAGWSTPDRLVFWGGLAVVWAASVASLMATHDPRWLDQALGIRAGQVMWARVRVATAYAAGALLPVVAVLGLRHGDAVAILGMVILCGVSACLSSVAARVWRTNAPWAYGPMGLVVWSAFVRMVG